MKTDLLKIKLKLDEMLLNKTTLDSGMTLAKMLFCHNLGVAPDSTLVLKEVIAINKKISIIFKWTS